MKYSNLHCRFEKNFLQMEESIQCAYWEGFMEDPTLYTPEGVDWCIENEEFINSYCGGYNDLHYLLQHWMEIREIAPRKGLVWSDWEGKYIHQSWWMFVIENKEVNTSILHQMMEEYPYSWKGESPKIRVGDLPLWDSLLEERRRGKARGIEYTSLEVWKEGNTKFPFLKGEGVPDLSDLEPTCRRIASHLGYWWDISGEPLREAITSLIPLLRGIKELDKSVLKGKVHRATQHFTLFGGRVTPTKEMLKDISTLPLLREGRVGDKMLEGRKSLKALIDRGIGDIDMFLDLLREEDLERYDPRCSWVTLFERESERLENLAKERNREILSNLPPGDIEKERYSPEIRQGDEMRLVKITNLVRLEEVATKYRLCLVTVFLSTYLRGDMEAWECLWEDGRVGTLTTGSHWELKMGCNVCPTEEERTDVISALGEDTPLYFL